MRALRISFVVVAVVGLAVVFLPSWTPYRQTPSRFNTSGVQSPGPTADEEGGIARSPTAGRFPLRTSRPVQRIQPDQARRGGQRRTAIRPTVIERSSPAREPAATQPASEIGDPPAVTPPSADADSVAEESMAIETPAVEAPAAELPPPPLARPIVTPPILLTQSAAYPGDAYTVGVDRSLITPALRLLASEGRVVLRVFVHVDGTAGPVHLGQSSGNPALDRAAVEAASSWRFQPATRDGVPIEAWAVIPVRFVLP